MENNNIRSFIGELLGKAIGLFIIISAAYCYLVFILSIPFGLLSIFR